MSGDDTEGLGNSSLNTSRVPPQDGRKADPLPTTRTLPGNDQQEGLDATANQKSGNTIGNTDPSQVPQESHGGSNARSAPKPQGKDGNGAQKRQQQKKTN